MQRLLAAADGLYERVGQGINELPATCRPGISAARTLYQEIGRQVERNGLDSVTQRAVVSGRRKAALLSRSLMLPSNRSAVSAPAALDETAFLVDTVVKSDALDASRAHSIQAARIAVGTPAPAWWNLQDRALWLVDLFERLERQDRVR